MKLLKLMLSTILLGIGVGATYFIFEAIVSRSIDYIWFDLFNIEQTRMLIVPLTFIGIFLYYGVQHLWYRESENKQEEGLGDLPKPNLINILKVLVIGYLSLLAGASLGPEAILVPASILLGLMVAGRISKDKSIGKLFSLLAFVSLFTAFFSSMIAGIFGLWLALNKSKVKLNPKILFFSILASASTYLLLNIIDSKPYLDLSGGSLELSLVTVLLLIAAVFFGIFFVYILDFVMYGLNKLAKPTQISRWYIKALLVAALLSAVYVIGGPLTMFTGNESIQPMLQDSQELGLSGLLIILVTKILALGWSKVGGLRGGLVFPSVFVAAVVAAMASLYINNLHIGLATIMIVLGMLIANNKRHIMF